MKITALSPPSLEGDNSLSSRLRYAMSLVRVSQPELARMIDVKPQVIQYLCNSPVIKSKFTYQIAAALGISYAWLAEGKGNISAQQLAANSKQNRDCKVPVIQWQESLGWVEQCASFDTSLHDKWIATTVAVSPDCFALMVRDSSMQPRFDFGTTLIVSPNERVYENSFVVVRIADLNEVLLRQFVAVGEQRILHATNQALYRDINFCAEKDQIIGVVVQAHTQFVAD